MISPKCRKYRDDEKLNQWEFRESHLGALLREIEKLQCIEGKEDSCEVKGANISVEGFLPLDHTGVDRSRGGAGVAGGDDTEALEWADILRPDRVVSKLLLEWLCGCSARHPGCFGHTSAFMWVLADHKMPPQIARSVTGLTCSVSIRWSSWPVRCWTAWIIPSVEPARTRPREHSIIALMRLSVPMD